MPRDYADVTVVLDRSGSMNSIREATVKGFNEFIAEQKKVPGDGCWTLVLFDDKGSAKGSNEEFPKVVFRAIPQADVKAITQDDFQPRGMTALIDAVCLTINAIGQRLGVMSESERPNKVLVVIMTDGMENDSKEFTRDKMNEMISHQRLKYNWQFLFVGANQDSVAEAGKYGIPKSGSMNFAATEVGTQSAFLSVSRVTRGWKTDGNLTADQLLSPCDPEPDPANQPPK